LSGDLSNTRVLADSVLGVPYFADMTIEEIDHVADALARAVEAA
jgi:dTDP-4-amino-4,6-dideoxygalactose transaminase